MNDDEIRKLAEETLSSMENEGDVSIRFGYNADLKILTALQSVQRAERDKVYAVSEPTIVDWLLVKNALQDYRAYGLSECEHEPECPATQAFERLYTKACRDVNTRAAEREKAESLSQNLDSANQTNQALIKKYRQIEEKAEGLRALEDSHLVMLAALREKLPSTCRDLIAEAEIIRKQAGL